MRIGLDLRMLGGGSGISRYISELSHEILNQDNKNQYVLFFKDADESAGYKNYGHKIVVTGTPHYSWAEQLKLPKILNRENLDVMHFTHFNVPLFYRQPFIVTIHDLTHSLFPGKKKSHFFYRLAYNWVLRNAIKQAKKIIAISASTKNQVVEYFQTDPNKISVIYEGINRIFRMTDKQEALAEVTNKFHITKPYILYVGVMRRYKNLPALAQAFDLLQNRGLDYQLVLAGEEDLFYPEIKEKVLSQIADHGSLIMTGWVSDEDLLYLYNACSLFVLPSLAEGFGLTALEAAACGTPIACSDISTFREILGQAAEYFDPENVENMADVMARVLRDSQWAEELANAGLRRISHFSWKQAAEQTIKLYSLALSGSDARIVEG